MSRDGITGLTMVALGLITLFVLIPTQISQLSEAVLATGASPKAFPRVAAGGVTLFGALIVLEDWTRRRKAGAKGSIVRDESTATERDIPAVLIFFAAIVAYVVAMGIFGHFLTTPVAIAGFMLLLGERRWWRIVATALVTTALLSFFFRTLLNTILPEGTLF